MDTDQFLQQCGIVEERLALFEKAISTFEKLSRTSVRAVTDEEEKKYGEYMKKHVKKTADLTSSIRSRLKKLNASETRSNLLEKTQFTTLSNKFVELIAAYQSAQVAHSRGMQAKMERQFRVVYPDASDEEIQQAVENTSDSSFFQQALYSRRSDAQDILNNVEERHDEIVRLAQSVEELANLYQEMQDLVERQDQLVVDITSHVDTTRANMLSSRTEMTEAIRNKKNAKRRCFWLTVAVIILLIVIAAVLYFQFFHASVMAGVRSSQ